MNGSSARWPLLYVSVALTACSILLLELSLTRLFSVIFYYHFAFLAISIAMFGLGAGGIASYWVRSAPGRLFAKLGWISLLNGALVLAALWTVLRPDTEAGAGRLAEVYFATALPFVASGAILCLAVSSSMERISRVYFFDLAGASAGCLLLVPLLDRLGGPDTILTVSVLFALSSAGWFAMASSRTGMILGLTAAAAAGLFLQYNRHHRILDVKVAKGTELRHEIFVRWNSFSRIAVRREPGWGGPAIFIDADANTSIANEDVTALPPERRREWTRQWISSVSYVVRPGGKTLIIGPGGGLDVAQALASGSRDVTGVEINPIIVNDIMRGRFAAESKHLYFRPEVRVFIEDGRSFVRRSREKYQILQATLVDTWAATAAGAFALTESNLYTTDAFVDYLDHLTGDGLMSFTRWGFDPPRESLRLISLASEALARLGEHDPSRHVIVVREGSRQQLEGLGALDTVLIARKPFSAADIARVRDLLAGGRFQPVYIPGDRIPNPFTELLASKDRRAWLRNYQFDVSAVDDNRPFFFYTVQPRDLWDFFWSGSGDPVDYKINRAVPLLFGLVGVSLLATALVLLLPPFIPGVRAPRQRGVLPSLLYFAAIGAGFILIEVALIQKFVLFLGHPTYSLTVVIFVLLLSSSLGSYWSVHFRISPAWVTLLGLLLAASLGTLLDLGVGWPLPVKIAVTALLIAPLGFIMGMPFPAGLRRLEAWLPSAVQWAWSLNAAASVLGSALAIFCAVYLGLMQTMLAGALLYAMAHVLGQRRPPGSDDKLAASAEFLVKLESAGKGASQ